MDTLIKIIFISIGMGLLKLVFSGLVFGLLSKKDGYFEWEVRLLRWAFYAFLGEIFFGLVTFFGIYGINYINVFLGRVLIAILTASISCYGITIYLYTLIKFGIKINSKRPEKFHD